jgi:hypothetical protein
MPALPSTEEEFPGHSTHDATDAAAVAVLYKSTPQSVQGEEPTTFLYDPAAHAEHSPPSGPMNPILHTQLVSAVDPATDCEFTRHVEQEALPIRGLYVFTAHTEHVPPSGPEYPVLQTQIVDAI